MLVFRHVFVLKIMFDIARRAGYSTCYANGCSCHESWHVMEDYTARL